jgi:hypothetical protein
VLVVADEPTAETLLEQVPFARPPLVEALRIHAGEPMHPDGHSVALSLNQEVEVGAHQAPRVQVPVELRDDSPEQHAEPVAVVIVAKYLPCRDAFGSDVEDAVLGERRPGNPRHESTVPTRKLQR